MRASESECLLAVVFIARRRRRDGDEEVSIGGADPSAVLVGLNARDVLNKGDLRDVFQVKRGALPGFGARDEGLVRGDPFKKRKPPGQRPSGFARTVALVGLQTLPLRSDHKRLHEHVACLD